jgi:hypothetical protein
VLKTASTNMREAAKIGKNIKDALIMAFLSLSFAGAGIHALNRSIESGYLKDVVADFATEESPSSEILKKRFPKEATLDQILSDVYQGWIFLARKGLQKT